MGEEFESLPNKVSIEHTTLIEIIFCIEKYLFKMPRDLSWNFV